MSDEKVTWLEDDDRFYADIPNGVGDNITVTAHGKRKEIAIRIEEPWSGSTETGFGAISGVTLPREQAVAMAKWILRKVGE